MKELPETVRMRLRELTFGREYDSPMYAWTFSTGRCYAAILCERCPGTSGTDKSIVAWSCLTFEVDHFPVVGVYTSPEKRGLGLGSVVASYMLDRSQLQEGSFVYAVAENWPKWPAILRSFGLEHLEWD